MRVVLALAGVALLTAVPARSTPPAGLVAALLAEGRLAVFDIATGEPKGGYSASATPRYAVSRGRIARGTRPDQFYVILPEGTSGFVLAAFDGSSLTGRRIGPVPADQYAALAVGSRTGRVYAFGSIDGTVLALDPQTANVVARFSADNGCASIGGAVSSDERRFYVAYHGNCSGIEVFDVVEAGWKRVHHIESHGSLQLVGERVLAAVGGPDTVLEVDREGRVVRTIASGLPGSHLMELAVDGTGKTAYFTGSCVYTGGFSRVSLQANLPATVLVQPGNYAICGDRIAAALDGSWVATAPLRVTTDPRANRPGSVIIADARTGALVREIPTPSEVVDVAAIR